MKSSANLEKWATIVLGGAVVLGAFVLAMKGAPTVKSVPYDAGKDANAAALASATSVVADVAPMMGDGGSMFLGDLRDPSVADEAGVELPGDAPKSVRFAVVLVEFAGAQGAPPNARSKADALALATRLADDAVKDFHGAVQRGDSGSTDDAGRISRGFLEPAAELALFSLKAGGVSAPVETPRGYWIVKRTE